jgi:methylenetetrahydrofolate dehydrogenase (NADP+)/methenyltetrahydrofolate cyclohydrolase
MGFLCNHPAAHIDEAAIVRALDPRKDVEDSIRKNVAKLVLDDPSGFVPCTPLGVMRLLIESKININRRARLWFLAAA